MFPYFLFIASGSFLLPFLVLGEEVGTGLHGWKEGDGGFYKRGSWVVLHMDLYVCMFV
jgi:hypothetical protein